MARLESGEDVRNRIMENNRRAIESGVRATPTLIVEDQPVQGVPPLELFQEALREMVAELQRRRGEASGG